MDQIYLKEHAKAYLTSGDTQAERNLLYTGVRAIPVLAEALAEMLQDMGNIPVKRILDQMWRELFSDSPEIMKRVPRVIEEMSDKPGVSLAIRAVAEEATGRAWRLVSTFGNEGIESLLQLLQSRDPVIRCTAALIFAGAGQLSYSTVKSLERLTSYFGGMERGPATQIFFALILTILAKSGHEASEETIDEVCRDVRWSRGEFYENSIHDALLFVIRKGQIP